MFLLDTNIVSELPRRDPDPHLLAWFDLLPELAISSITLEELSYGVARATGRNAARLRDWLETLLAIPPQILPVDDRIARAAGELRAARDKMGRPAAQADMLIAATALIYGFTLATRNTADFDGCGIALINPFRR